MTDYKKMDAELEAAKNITLDEMAEAAADMTAEKQASDLRRASLNGVRLTLAGDPLPIDPDTGEIDTDKLTAEQLAEIKEAIKPIAETFLEISPGIKNIRDSVNRIQEQIRESSGIEKMQKAFETLSKSIATDEMRDLLRELRETRQPIYDLFDELDDLKIFIKAELELKKEEYGGLTFDDILGYTPRELLEMKADPDSLFYKVLEAARKAKAEALPVIDIHKTDKLNTPVDRVNFLAWNDFEETGGQMKFNLMSDRDKRDPEKQQLDISMIYSLSFADDPNIKMTKELQHYDRRLQQAIDTLYTTDASENYIFLIGDIFRAMGGKGEPNSTQRNNINRSLTKQGTGRIYMNNKAEARNYDYPEIHYDGNILDFERIRVIYNGQEVTAIRLLRRPVFMEFAEQRNQMTAVPLKVLQSGISQTNNHLRIEDYLLYRISHQKNEIAGLREKQGKKYTQNRQAQIRKKSKLVIKLERFHENAGTANKKKRDKDRAEETAERYLSHYKKCGYISDYKLKTKESRIEITLPIE